MHVEFVNYASIYLSIHPSNKRHYQHRCTCPSIIHHPCIKTCLSIYLSNLLSDIIWVRRPYVWWTFVIMYAVCRLQLLVVTSTNARFYTIFEPFYRTLLCHNQIWYYCIQLGPFLLTAITSMLTWGVKLFIHERHSRWSLGMAKLFHSTLVWVGDYWSMLGLKLIHVSKSCPLYVVHWKQEFKHR